MHAPGNSRALVLLIVIPSEEAPPARTEQRHFGLFCTTLANAEQHEEDGVVELPLMKPRHGAMLMIVVVHPDCADEFANITANTAKPRKPIVNILWAILKLELFLLVLNMWIRVWVLALEVVSLLNLCWKKKDQEGFIKGVQMRSRIDR